MRIIAYVRVSTAEQAASGLGLEAQQATIKRECEHRGWRIVQTIRDEGHSGGTLARPGVREALERIAAGGADGLIVAKLDRLTRSTLDFALLVEWFVEADAALVALDLAVDTSSPGGEMLATVMAAFAQWERKVIAQRTRDALAELRAQGKPAGRPAVADNQALAERIRQMRRDQGMTLQAIADTLNHEGTPTLRGGKEWRPSSVENAAGYKRRKPRRTPTDLPELRRRPDRRAR